MTKRHQRCEVVHIGKTKGKSTCTFCALFHIKAKIKVRTMGGQLLLLPDILSISSSSLVKYYGDTLWDIYRMALLSTTHLKKEMIIDLTDDSNNGNEVSEYNFVINSLLKVISNTPIVIKHDTYTYIIPYSPYYNQDGIEITISTEPVYDKELEEQELDTIQVGRVSQNFEL